MVPGQGEYEDNEVQGSEGGDAPGAGEANNDQLTEPVNVPIQGSPGGVYRVGEDGMRVRVQD